ncbi:hypothetical protein [Streptomyces sp. enrichment culture]|uniref:hypothetical protein n=1 Tax=Streptomyces sp. enrichment culture TaxID=1795815 RepID=UPI003F563483
MSRDMQHRLRFRLELATQMLDLPLTGEHLERLAIELAPAVKAIVAEEMAAHAETVPVAYGVVRTDLDAQAGVHTTTYAGCTARIGTEVDLESPAALLAAELRGQQPDVIATDVPSATYLGLTVRPQSLHAWRWWIDKLGVHPEAITRQDDAVFAMGVVGDVAVALCGEGVPTLMVDEPAARLMGLLAETDEAPV